MPLITHLHNVFTFVKLSPTKISLICCCKLFHISFIFKLNRGTSTITKHAPFREEYGRLHEIRSLIGTDVSFVALTATAVRDTKKCIIDTLNMFNPLHIYQNPNKGNVTYSVSYIQQSSKIDDTFQWIINNIVQMKNSAERVIIYCQTIKQCSVLYSTLRAHIGDHFYASQGGISGDRHPVLEMLHSCTPMANKDYIINSLQDPNGLIKILIATIAFGMGVDCKGVHISIHFGPPKNIEAYLQESGRVGRDGKPSKSFILYQGTLLGHVEKNIKEYLSAKECRRKILMEHFGFGLWDVDAPKNLHLCCDNCAIRCACGENECKSYSVYPGIINPDLPGKVPYDPNTSRDLNTEQRIGIKNGLVKYQKKLLINTAKKVANTQMHLHVPAEMLIGFGSVQIDQVLEKCDYIFTIEDVYKLVEIWHHDHASSIYNIICQVCGDTPDVTHDSLSCDLNSEDEDYEELINNEWAKLLEDDDLLTMAIENMSISQLFGDSNVENNTGLSDSYN